MSIWIIVAVAAGTVPPLSNELSTVTKAAVDEALTCQVYSAFGKMAHADNSQLVAIDDMLLRYWSRRSRTLGAAAGLTAEGLMMRESIIPIAREKLTPVLMDCFKKTPENERH